MNLPRYPVVASQDYHIYAFHSEGPRGSIEKNVVYTRIEGSLYSLGFGDWYEETQDISDTARSNNGDRDKILATVAFTALEFTRYYPGTELFFEGSNPARTRLYQMGIARYLPAIRLTFDIFGFAENNWEPFLPGRRYKAFLAVRKKL
jgi:hypothetical protein